MGLSAGTDLRTTRGLLVLRLRLLRSFFPFLSCRRLCRFLFSRFLSCVRNYNSAAPCLSTSLLFCPVQGRRQALGLALVNRSVAALDLVPLLFFFLAGGFPLPLPAVLAGTRHQVVPATRGHPQLHAARGFPRPLPLRGYPQVVPARDVPRKARP